MPAFFEIEKHHRLVITSASGVVTMAEALAHNQKLRKDPDFDPSFSQLIDLSNVTKIELNREDILTLAQDPILSDNSRRAILATGDLTFGLARMFEMFRESKGKETIRVFRNRDEARAWVLGKNTAA